MNPEEKPLHKNESKLEQESGKPSTTFVPCRNPLRKFNDKMIQPLLEFLQWWVLSCKGDHCTKLSDSSNCFKVFFSRTQMCLPVTSTQGLWKSQNKLNSAPNEHFQALEGLSPSLIPKCAISYFKNLWHNNYKSCSSLCPSKNNDS